MDALDPPVLKWVGAKWLLADWIVDKLPPHDTYVEPFAGSAAIFFRKQPARIEVLNDLNHELINFFDVLRARTNEFIRAIELTPYSRDEYERSYIITDQLDELERARRFYVRCWQAWSGYGGRKVGWRFQIRPGWGVSTVEQFARTEGLWKGAQRLRQAHIEQDSAIDVIKRYDSARTVFYIDPPYVMKSRSDGGRLRYEHEMKDGDHRELAAILNQVSGMVLLSGYDSDLYRELYAGWSICTQAASTNGSQTIEYLWMNPAAIRHEALPLFDGPVESR